MTGEGSTGEGLTGDGAGDGASDTAGEVLLFLSQLSSLPQDARMNPKNGGDGLHHTHARARA